MPSSRTADSPVNITSDFEGVPRWRSILLRTFYALAAVALGSSVWPAIVRGESWKPMERSAVSVWAAFSALAILGLRYPLRMLPLLLLNLLYKIIWLLVVALPLWKGGAFDATAHSLFVACTSGAILDVIVIPWRFVLKSFVLKPRS